MIKSIVYKLIIDLERNSSLLTGSSSISNLADEVNKFHSTIVEELSSIGFTLTRAVPVNMSQRNGGYALYNKFVIDNQVLKATLLIDIRSGDHPSKPDLSTKNDVRIAVDVESLPQFSKDDIDVEDTYLARTSNGSIVYYVGKGESYGDPIQSEELAIRVVVSRVKSFVSTRFKFYADEALSKYDKEAVSIASDYLDDIAGLTISEDTGFEVIDIKDTSSYIKELKDMYIQEGVELGCIQSVRQFETICKLIQAGHIFE